MPWRLGESSIYVSVNLFKPSMGWGWKFLIYIYIHIYIYPLSVCVYVRWGRRISTRHILLKMTVKDFVFAFYLDFLVDEPYIYIYIYIYHNHHSVPLARNSPTLSISRHSSLSSIAPCRSSILHPVSVQNICR